LLSGKFASPVYALFGKGGILAEELSPIDTPVGDSIGYHIRTGHHDLTDFDWARYMDFAARHRER
jgi:hypothetical protein